MSLMDQIKRAWDDAVRAVNGRHSYDDIPAGSLAEEFMTRLKRIPTGIDIILTSLYSNYAGSRSSLRGIERDYAQLEERHNKLKDENDQLEKHFILIQRVKKHLKKDVKELEKLNATQVELSNDLLDQREVLESSLNTSRYFIYLSGMCGFVLGLACLYLVV